ncbi:hypothetical protein [Micropruina sp.]|uniref:hypothetical protein n=1 Tax=Micropruina sp. TaxID=2737536 RepID=UPI0039E31C6F
MPVLAIIVTGVMVWSALRGSYPIALAVASAFGAGAIVVGGTALPVFQWAALGALLLVVLSAMRRPACGELERTRIPGFDLLALFAVWSAVVTIVSPFLFAGVVAATEEAPTLAAGQFTQSNIAQIIYLMFGLAVVALLARSPITSPRIIGLSLAIALGLSLWRYMGVWFGVPFPFGIFDNSPAMAYIETEPGGAARFRGIFSEPAALATCALMASAYGLATAAQEKTRPLRAAGGLCLAGVAIFLGAVSTSTTFIVGIVALAALWVVTGLLRLLAGMARVTATGVVAICVTTTLAVSVLPTVVDLLRATVNRKTGTDSFDNRTGADADAFRAFFETWGFGLGLGSSRASSFIPTMLAAVGVIGVAILLAAITTMAATAWLAPSYRPVVWVLASFMIVRLISGPELSGSTGALWMLLGVLAHGGLVATETDTGRPLPLPVTRDPFARARML